MSGFIRSSECFFVMPLTVMDTSEGGAGWVHRSILATSNLVYLNQSWASVQLCSRPRADSSAQVCLQPVAFYR